MIIMLHSATRSVFRCSFKQPGQLWWSASRSAKPWQICSLPLSWTYLSSCVIRDSFTAACLVHIWESAGLEMWETMCWDMDGRHWVINGCHICCCRSTYPTDCCVQNHTTPQPGGRRHRHPGWQRQALRSLDTLVTSCNRRVPKSIGSTEGSCLAHHHLAQIKARLEFEASRHSLWSLWWFFVITDIPCGNIGACARVAKLCQTPPISLH